MLRPPQWFGFGLGGLLRAIWELREMGFGLMDPELAINKISLWLPPGGELDCSMFKAPMKPKSPEYYTTNPFIRGLVFI